MCSSDLKAEHPKPRPPAQEPRDPARTRPCPSGPTRPGPTRRSFPDARLPCTPCSSVAPRTSTATRAARPDPEAATAAPCPCAFDTDAPRPRRAATRAKEQSRCDRPFLPALLEFNRAVFPPLNFPLHECHHADHHFLPLVLLSPSPPSINWTPRSSLLLPARALLSLHPQARSLSHAELAALKFVARPLAPVCCSTELRPCLRTFAVRPGVREAHPRSTP